MRVLLFALLNSLVFAAAMMVTDMLFSSKSRGVRFLSTLCLYVTEIIWLEIIAGILGKLTFFSMNIMAGGLFVILLIIWLTLNRHGLSRQILSRRLILVPLLFAVGTGFGWLAGNYGFKGTHFCEDDLFYHGTAVAQWFVQQDVSMLKCLYDGYNFNGYKWFNAELISLWFLLPFGQDGMVFLAGLFWLAVTCVAAVVVMQEFSIDCRWYGPVIFSIVCSDVLLYQATLTFSAVDLTGPAMLLSALAVLLSAMKTPYSQSQSSIVLAGLCAGFACGSKVTFVLPTFILAVWVFFVWRKTWCQCFENTILFICSAFSTGGFWYIRNMVLTGNPFFPAQAGPFDGPMTHQLQFGTSIAGYIVESGYDFSVILEILRRHIAWPQSMFLVSLMGFISGLVCLYMDKQHRKKMGLMLLIATSMLIAYVFMPFSARNGVGMPLSISLRFIISPFLTGLLMVSLFLNIRHKLRWLVYGIYLAALVTAFHASPNAIKFLVGSAAIFSLAVFSIYRKPFPLSIFSLGWSLCILAGIFTGLALTFPIQQAKTDRRLFDDRLTGLNLGGCWQRLDKLPTGSRIMVFGALGYCSYPSYGRHYQIIPWPRIPANQLYQPPHILWKTNSGYFSGWPKPAGMDTQTWIMGLLGNQADYMVIQRFRDQPWHTAYEILAKTGYAEQIDQGDCWSIWEIKKTGISNL